MTSQQLLNSDEFYIVEKMNNGGHTDDKSLKSLSIETVDNEDDDKDLHRKSSESTTLADSQNGTVTVEAKKRKVDAWESYYHFLVALMMINIIPDWTPNWYEESYMSRGLLATHFILILVFIHLPINYMEVFLAQYTKEPPINLWKICPIFLGYCYALIGYTVLQSSLDTVKCARTLLYLMETVFDRAPWLRCAPELGTGCLVLDEKTKLSMDCSMADDTTKISCPNLGTFDLSAQHWFKSRYKALDDYIPLHTQWKLVVCSVAHWGIVLLSVVRTIYRFGKLIYCLGVAVLIFFLVDFLYIMYNVDAKKMIKAAFHPPEPSDFVNEKFWALVYISTMWRSHTTMPPLTMTFVSKVDAKFNIACCAAIVTFSSFITVLLKTMLGAGLLMIFSKRLNVDPQVLANNNASNSLALIPQYFGILPMPLMWTFYWFATRYLLLWLKSTMVVQAVLDNIFLKNNVRKEFRIYFVSLYCVGGCIINSIIIIKKSALAKMYVIYSEIVFSGISMLPVIESVFILLIYGLGVFINDIQFMCGSRPTFFWRFCWRTLPFTLLALYVSTFVANLNEGYPPLGTFLWIVKGALYAIIPVFALKQIAYAVYNDNLAYLFNPVFDWGPQDKEIRKARKRFNPNTDIRSQPERTVDYVKPHDSENQMDIE